MWPYFFSETEETDSLRETIDSSRFATVLSERPRWFVLTSQGLLLRLQSSVLPPVVIAEAADAHYGDLSRAKDMASRALVAGADVIKFQHHIPDQEMLREIPMSSNMREPLWDFLERNALTISQHVELSNHCKEIGITYACTPFSFAAAEELESSVAPLFYKIGSGEMLDFPTLEKIAAFGRPMFVSTGMSTRDEVQELYAFLRPKVDTLVLLNCTSAYPAEASEIHLAFVSEMREKYRDVIVGHSEHSKAPHFSLAAIALGARVIERHVTADPALEGPDDAVSMTFEDLAVFVSQARELSQALSVQKAIHPREIEIRSWAHRSLVYTESLQPGDILKSELLWSKRPGTGIPARYRNQFVGRRLVKAVEADTLLEPSDFEEAE